MAGAEDGFGLVDQQERQVALGGLFAALDEEFAYLALGFAEPHVEDFRSFDAEEELLPVLAGFLADLESQVMGGGFAEEGFAAARGP